MTPLRVSVVAAAAALVLLFVIFELIRSRRLQERYAMLWLLTGIVMLVLGLWRGLLSSIADLVGIAYPPSARARSRVRSEDPSSTTSTSKSSLQERISRMTDATVASSL